MSSLLQSVTIMSVADLYAQFARLSHSYSQEDNPLAGLTAKVPASAEYFVVVPSEDAAEAETLMNRVRRRRKLRQFTAEADEIRYSPFTRSGKLSVFYA